VKCSCITDSVHCISPRNPGILYVLLSYNGCFVLGSLSCPSDASYMRDSFSTYSHSPCARALRRAWQLKRSRFTISDNGNTCTRCAMRICEKEARRHNVQTSSGSARAPTLVVRRSLLACRGASSMRYRTGSSAKSRDDVMLVAVFPMLLIRPVPDCQAAKNTHLSAHHVASIHPTSSNPDSMRMTLYPLCNPELILCISKCDQIALLAAPWPRGSAFRREALCIIASKPRPDVTLQYPSISAYAV
jgi:hypothetical protein